VSDLAFRPRSVPELLDASFQILRRHYGQFVVISGVLYIPFIAAQIFLLRDTLSIDPATGALPDGYFASFLGVMLFSLVWMAVADAALQLAAADAYRGHAVSGAAALRQVFAQFGPIVLASLNKAVRVWLWTLLFIVPGVIAYMRYFAVPTTVVLEGRRGGDALARARQLSDGEKWKAFKVLAAAWLIYFALLYTLQTIALVATSSQLVSGVAGSVFSIFTYPIIGISLAVLYYDVRIRKEGYDIELMAQSLEAPAAAQPAL
jgi:hypothetical protein